MPTLESANIYGVQIRESANDGSDFSNAAADYRILFVGEDGLFHLKDSAGTVTTPTGLADPMTTRGDIIIRNASNVTARLGRGSAGQVLQSDGTDVAWQTPSAGGVTPAVCEGRLTLTTGVPITTTDVTAATTLYFTPYKGNRIATYSGSAWSTAAFTEKSITLATLTSGLPYDVYIVDSTLALELTAWTNTTTRATALVLQDGVYCKTGSLTRRYLGTICIAATGQCEDTLLQRYVWNYYNRVLRKQKVIESTDSWTYNSATYRQARASTANKVEYVCGVSEDIVRVRVIHHVNSAGNTDGNPGIGIDSTSTNSADLFFNWGTAGICPVPATYDGYPGIGYHSLVWLESARAGTVTFYGDQGIPANTQSGMIAELFA